MRQCSRVFRLILWVYLLSVALWRSCNDWENRYPHIYFVYIFRAHSHIGGWTRHCRLLLLRLYNCSRADQNAEMPFSLVLRVIMIIIIYDCPFIILIAGIVVQNSMYTPDLLLWLERDNSINNIIGKWQKIICWHSRRLRFILKYLTCLREQNDEAWAEAKICQVLSVLCDSLIFMHKRHLTNSLYLCKVVLCADLSWIQFVHLRAHAHAQHINAKV